MQSQGCTVDFGSRRSTPVIGTPANEISKRCIERIGPGIPVRCGASQRRGRWLPHSLNDEGRIEIRPSDQADKEGNFAWSSLDPWMNAQLRGVATTAGPAARLARTSTRRSLAASPVALASPCASIAMASAGTPEAANTSRTASERRRDRARL